MNTAVGQPWLSDRRISLSAMTPSTMIANPPTTRIAKLFQTALWNA